MSHNKTMDNTKLLVLPVVPSDCACSVSVTVASKSDASAIAEIGGESWAATYGHAIPEDDVKDLLINMWSDQAVSAELSDCSKTYVVARDTRNNNRVVGIARMHRGENPPSIQAEAQEMAVIQKVHVDKRMHGRGIGRMLITAIEELARAEGKQQIWLTVWEENSKAQEFYRRLGYREISKMESVFKTGIWREHVLIKRLLAV